MNKCLKDFVVRSKTMMGLDCAYVPGWDCHGLPIEHKVMTELQDAGKLAKIMGLEEGTRKMAVRNECKKYAEKFHKLHTGQMQRLLTLADYEHPYLTMQPQYEAAVLEVLAGLAEQGLVYRAVKPVHWSVANETALAEAELEYYDREDTSVYVDFEALDAAKVYDAFGLKENAEDAEETEESETEGDGGKTESAKNAGTKARRPSTPAPLLHDLDHHALDPPRKRRGRRPRQDRVRARLGRWQRHGHRRRRWSTESRRWPRASRRGPRNA